jgi:hypothetical protein
MPSPCTQAGTSVEKHTSAVRNAAGPKGIYNPRAVDEGKMTASLTENNPITVRRSMASRGNANFARKQGVTSFEIEPGLDLWWRYF